MSPFKLTVLGRLTIALFRTHLEHIGDVKDIIRKCKGNINVGNFQFSDN